MVNNKVRIKGVKQILTLNGESFIDGGVKYIGVKERTYSIPEDQIIPIEKKEK
jgi:hypothetical protein